MITGISHSREVSSFGAFVCVTIGTLGGLLNGLFTEYYTSKEYEPVRELAEAVSDFIINFSRLILHSVPLELLPISFTVYPWATNPWCCPSSASPS